MLKGLLFSQVGYEPGYPVRMIVRSTEADFISSDARCSLKGQEAFECGLSYWGEVWKSHWWVAEFSGKTTPGLYEVSLEDGGKILLEDQGLRIQKGVLWDETVYRMSVEMLEPRAVMAKANSGWMDAGAMWQESNAQSSMVCGLLDLVEFGRERLDKDHLESVYAQIINGCHYLVQTQEKALELGFPEGAISHDIIGHEYDILPNDAFKAVMVWHRAVQLLPEAYSNEKASYLEAATKSLQWLQTDAKPMGDTGHCRFQRGLPEDTVIPAEEWPTRDLVMRCWGEYESWKNGNEADKIHCVETVRRLMNRQIKSEEPENGFYGHFWEFDSLKTSELSWTHSISGGKFGSDAGGTYPNYLICLIRMLEAWPDHEDADDWRETLERFTYGYLLPGCKCNPFYLVPQGIFGEQGALWFTATFHGTNVIYGLTAALAMELHSIFKDPELIQIAYGNLQWVAGLNGGLTAQAIKDGCTIFRDDIPDELAVPVSMIHRVGNRTAGTWFGTRGVVCNGFSVGKQFVFDTAALKENDGPHSLTDEDWIPHSAGWLSGLVRLQKIP